MMILLYSSDLLESRRKEVSPVVGGNNCSTIFAGNQLGVVSLGGVVDDFCYGLQAADLCPPVLALE